MELINPASEAVATFGIDVKKNARKASKVLKSISPNLMSVDDICNWYKNLEKTFNSVVSRHNPKIKISFAKVYGRKDFVELKQKSLSKAILQEGMYAETCDSISRSIAALSEGNNIALLGLIQSCKSATQTGCIILYSVAHYLQKQQILMPIFILPNGDSFIGQFTEKLSLVSTLLEDAIVSVGKKSMTVSDYFRYKVFADRNEIAKKYIDSENIINRNKVAKILNEVVAREHVVIPVSRKYQETIRILVNAANKENWLTVIVRDESHQAVSKNGVNDDMLGGQFQEEGYETISEDEKAIYAMIRDKNVRVLAVSANNWPAMIDPFVPIPILVNDSYCGLDFRYWMNSSDEVGKLVARDSGVNIRLPEILSLSNFANRVNSPDLQYVRGTLYGNLVNFNNYLIKHAGMFPFRTHEEYKSRCNKAIAAACDWIFKNNPKNSKMSPKRGVLIRLCNGNKPSEEFAAHLEKTLKGIKVIRYFDDSFTTIPDLLKRNGVCEKDQYVIIATARARMSDSFPIHCAYGLDFTNLSYTLSACLQGVLGRMSGYHKHPLVVLSDANEKRIREYIESDYRIWHGKRLGTAAARRSRAYMKFERKNFGKNHLQMNAIFEKISNEILLPSKKIKWHDQENCKVIMGDKTPACFFDVLTRQEIEYLTKIALAETNRRLIAKNEIDTEGGQYAITSVGHVKGTVRMQLGKRDTKKGGNQSQPDKSTGREYRILYRVGRRYNKPYLEGFDVPLYRKFQTLGDIENSSIFTRIEKDEKKDE